MYSAFAPRGNTTAEYLEEHDVVDLFENLLVAVLREKPVNPISWMAGFMEEQVGGQRGLRTLDPKEPPTGLFGVAGKTGRKRSEVLGLGLPESEWGNLVDECSNSEASSSASGIVFVQRHPMLVTPRNGGSFANSNSNHNSHSLSFTSGCVNFYDLKLREVPAQIFSQSKVDIVNLDLSSNDLTVLPNEIGVLQHLEHLNVSSNYLTSLPAELANIAFLHTLAASDNSIASLPEEFKEMDQLRVLNLDWNDLSVFPAVHHELESLRLIENPNLTSFPDVSVLRKFSNLFINIDNTPKLANQWKNMPVGSISCTIEWNCVYPDEIMPGLFLGSLRSAQHPRVYTDLGITYLASIGRELRVVKAEGMKHLKLNVDDISGCNLTSVFNEAHEFIEQALSSGTAVLVHCFKGQSRSATIVISYLIKKFCWSAGQALSYVKERSPRIDPNPGFRSLLVEYSRNFRRQSSTSCRRQSPWGEKKTKSVDIF